VSKVHIVLLSTPEDTSVFSNLDPRSYAYSKFHLKLSQMWDIMVTGSNGLLGGFLVPLLRRKGYKVLATGRGGCRLPSDWFDDRVVYRSLDITDGMAVWSFVNAHRPRYIIHTAAMTQADDCELHPVACWDVNVTATRFLCHAASAVNASMVYVSTDFIFDGESGPYRETDIPGPVNYYGSSKLAAERAVMSADISWAIVRTVLVYGRSYHQARSNIMTWVRDSLTEGKTIRVVDDQVRTPTYAGDLAEGILKVVERKAAGVWHVSGGEFLTPFEMAAATAEFLGLDAGLMTRVSADTFSQPARRPLRTGFVIEKARTLLEYAPLSFMEGMMLTLGTGPDPH
jgi:dTDP-4-dehydrorhamnose reductase